MYKLSIVLAIVFFGANLFAQTTDSLLIRLQKQAMEKRASEIALERDKAAEVSAERNAILAFEANKQAVEGQISTVEAQILAKKETLKSAFTQTEAIYQRISTNPLYAVRQTDTELFGKAKSISNFDVNSINLLTTEFTPQIPTGLNVQQKADLTELQRTYQLLKKKNSAIQAKIQELSGLQSQLSATETDYSAALASYNSEVQSLTDTKNAYQSSGKDIELRIQTAQNRISELRPQFRQALGEDLYVGGGAELFDGMLSKTWQVKSVSMTCTNEQFAYLVYLSLEKSANIKSLQDEICTIKKQNLAKLALAEELEAFIQKTVDVIKSLEPLNTDLDEAKLATEQAQGLSQRAKTLYEQALQAYQESRFEDAIRFANASIAKSEKISESKTLLGLIEQKKTPPKKKRGFLGIF